MSEKKGSCVMVECISIETLQKYLTVISSTDNSCCKNTKCMLYAYQSNKSIALPRFQLGKQDNCVLCVMYGHLNTLFERLYKISSDLDADMIVDFNDHPIELNMPLFDFSDIGFNDILDAQLLTDTVVFGSMPFILKSYVYFTCIKGVEMIVLHPSLFKCASESYLKSGNYISRDPCISGLAFEVIHYQQPYKDNVTDECMYRIEAILLSKNMCLNKHHLLAIYIYCMINNISPIGLEACFYRYLPLSVYIEDIWRMLRIEHRPRTHTHIHNETHPIVPAINEVCIHPPSSVVAAVEQAIICKTSKEYIENNTFLIMATGEILIPLWIEYLISLSQSRDLLNTQLKDGIRGGIKVTKKLAGFFYKMVQECCETTRDMYDEIQKSSLNKCDIIGIRLPNIKVLHPIYYCVMGHAILSRSDIDMTIQGKHTHYGAIIGRNNQLICADPICEKADIKQVYMPFYIFAKARFYIRKSDIKDPTDQDMSRSGGFNLFTGRVICVPSNLDFTEDKEPAAFTPILRTLRVDTRFLFVELVGYKKI